MSSNEENHPGPCPVCLNFPLDVPITQCENGHVVCSTCRPQISVCAVCRSDIQRPIRSLSHERWQESVLVSCVNGKCPAKFTTEEDQLVHVSQDCKHRKMKICQYIGIDPDCHEEFELKDAQTAHDHIVTVHKDKNVNAANFQSRENKSIFLTRDATVKCFLLDGMLAVIMSGVMCLCQAPTRKLGILPIVIGTQSQVKNIQLTTSAIHLQTTAPLQPLTGAGLDAIVTNPSTRTVTTTGPITPVLSNCECHPLRPHTIIIEGDEKECIVVGLRFVRDGNVLL